MGIEWTNEKLKTLSLLEIENLLENAKAKNVSHIIELCLEEISNRRIAGKRVNVVGRTTRERGFLRNLEGEANESLVKLAEKLSSEYALVCKQSVGKLKQNLKPLFLSKRTGESKIGGVKFRGEVLIYRYISYKDMGIGISLAAVLREEDESKLRWRVDGPDSMLPDKQELYEGLEISKGQWHSEFETAAASFRNLFFSVARAHR